MHNLRYSTINSLHHPALQRGPSNDNQKQTFHFGIPRLPGQQTAKKIRRLLVGPRRAGRREECRQALTTWHSLGMGWECVNCTPILVLEPLQIFDLGPAYCIVFLNFGNKSAEASTESGFIFLISRISVAMAPNESTQKLPLLLG